MSFLAFAKTLLAILPVITEVVQAVEVVKQDASGSAKKALALDLVRTVYNASTPVVPFDDMAAQIDSTVDAVVGLYNATGSFVKSIKKAA